MQQDSARNSLDMILSSKTTCLPHPVSPLSNVHLSLTRSCRLVGPSQKRSAKRYFWDEDVHAAAREWRRLQEDDSDEGRNALSAWKIERERRVTDAGVVMSPLFRFRGSVRLTSSNRMTRVMLLLLNVYKVCRRKRERPLTPTSRCVSLTVLVLLFSLIQG